MQKLFVTSPCARQFKSLFFILAILSTVLLSSAQAEPVDTVITDIYQLKQETIQSVSHYHVRRWLLVKANKALVHARKSKRHSENGKPNKAQKQLGRTWNNIQSYYKRVIHAQGHGAISTSTADSLNLIALRILNTIESTGTHSLLIEIDQLKADTIDNVSHGNTRKFLKKKLKKARKNARKGIKFSIQGKDQKAQNKYIQARNQMQSYIDRLESAVTDGKVDQVMPLI